MSSEIKRRGLMLVLSWLFGDGAIRASVPEALHPPRAVAPAGPPLTLPRYALGMTVDVARHEVRSHLRVTWTNVS